MGYAIEAKEVILKAARGGSGTETFVYEPATVDEEPFGNIYVIGWLNSRKAQFEFLPNLIASVIRREFYKPGEGTPEGRFEIALKKANAALEDIGKTNKNIAQDVNFAIVNITQDKVRFCVLGDIVTLLSRNGVVTDMSADQKSKNKKELFSSIIAGDIYPADGLIFSTGRVMDLFSESGITKLFSLDLAKQAEIISKLYHKHNQGNTLPSQAAVLLKVKNVSAVSRWLPFSAAPRQKTAAPLSGPSPEPVPRRKLGDRLARVRGVLVKTKNIVRRAASKRGILIIAIASAAALTLAAGITASLKTRRVAELSAQLAALEQMEENDAEKTVAQLKAIQEQAIAAMSFWYTTAAAQELFLKADERIAHLSGIHKEPLETIASIDARSLKFTPSFLFADDAFIYVFGSSPDSYLKIEKNSKTGSFSFLKLPDAFETERMVAQNGDFYFINDTQKAAYVLFTEDNELVKVVRTLNKILATRSEKGVRTAQQAAYALDGGHIIKTRTDGKRELFMLNGIHDAADLVISAEGKILLLTKEKVLAFPHQ